MLVEVLLVVVGNQRSPSIVEPDMTKVLIYARLSVSTEESVSISRQIEACQQYAASRGWEVIGEPFVDDGVSASKVKPEARPGWRSLLAAVEQEKPHAVIVWKVDRLARRVLDFLNADNALREFGGSGIVCVADPIDMTTPQGRAFATVLAVFAELEAESIAARVKDARRALLKAGRRGGGRPPYGWTNVPNPDGPGIVLAQDPATIGYVAEAAERALRGDSLYSITTWLNESGAPLRPHKGRKHNRWNEAGVEVILRNPVLAGLVPYAPGRKVNEAQDPWAVLRDEDGVPVVDESVAVLSVADRRRLLDTLDARLRPGSRPRQGKTPTLLSSLLRCGSCGRTLHRSTSGGGYDGYRCTNRECPAQATVNRARAEQYVIGQVLAERGETREHEYVVVGQDDEALAGIEEALREAGAQLATTDDDEESDRLLTWIANLKARRAEARKVSAVVTKRLAAPVRGQQTWAEEFEAAAGDVPEQQRLLREQIEYVTVRPTGQNARTTVADRADIEWVPLGDRDVA
jgi:site-specific DNA recombinase